MKKRIFAEARWRVDDIHHHREEEGLPPWTDEQAASFLERFGKTIRDGMIEAGWGVIDQMMSEYGDEIDKEGV